MARRSRTHVEVIPTADWPRVVVGLAAQSKAFSDALESIADEQLREATDDARSTLISMPTKGPGRGARQVIADNTRYRVTTNTIGTGRAIDARAEVSNMPVGMQALPRLFDKRRFRHPVYGNHNVWVEQRGRPWFVGRMRKAGRTIQQRIEDHMENVVRSIGRLG